jgi:stress response protein SCP2
VSTPLAKGQNAPISAPDVIITVNVATPVDVSALLVKADGKVRSDADFVFYNQPMGPGVRLQPSPAGQPAGVAVTFASVPAEIEQVRAVITLDDATSNFGRFPAPVAQVKDLSGTVLYEYRIEGLSTESIVIAMELYRHQGAWKVRAVGQGYAGGFAALVTDHGVSVDDAPAPAAVAAAHAPSAGLGSRKGTDGLTHEQGTGGSLDSLLERYADIDPDLADQLRKARENGTLEYWQVTPEVDAAGRFQGVSARQFDSSAPDPAAVEHERAVEARLRARAEAAARLRIEEAAAELARANLEIATTVAEQWAAFKYPAEAWASLARVEPRGAGLAELVWRASRADGSGVVVLIAARTEDEPLASAADARGRVFEQGTRGFLELELAVLDKGDPGLAGEISAALAAGAVEYWDVVAKFDEEGRFDRATGRLALLAE